MSRIPDPNQTSIALAAQFLLTHFVIGLISAILFQIFMANLTALPSLILAAIICGVLGLLLNVNIQISLHQLDWILIQLIGLQPNQQINPKKHGPLAGIMRKIALLTEKERPFTTQRERLLQQTSEAAAQETRNRLGRDLHDSIKQQLFSINISTAAAQNRLPDAPKEAKAILEDVRHSTQGALVEMNALLQQLSPAPLEKVGLVEALEEQCAALEYRTGAAVAVQIEPLPENELFPTGAQEALFRIAQEALSNIARHARADNVSLHLFNSQQQLILEIQDDGAGFDETAVTPGMGLANIKNRVSEMGGKLQMKTQPYNGTHLQIAIPLLQTISKKEQLMIQTNHAYNRFSLVGIGGGVVLSALLFYPLYQFLPGLFIDHWGGGVAFFSSLFGLLSLPLLVLIGYYGTKQVAQSSKGLNILSGAISAVIAAAIFYFLLGGSAAIIFGGRTLLEQGVVTTETETEFLFYLVEAITGIIWAVYVGFWALVPISALCGALGGWFAPLNLKRKSPITPSMLLTLPTSFILSSAFALLNSVAIFSLFSEQVTVTAQNVSEEGYILSLASSGTFFWPIMTSILIYFAGLVTAVYLLYYFSKNTPFIQERDYLIQLNTVFLTTAVLPFIIMPLNPSDTLLRISLGLNFVASLLIVHLINRTEQQYPSNWLQGTKFAPVVLWITAVLPFTLLNFNQLDLAISVGIIGLFVYFATNRRDRTQHDSNKTAEKQSRLAIAMGAILPANLTLILPQTPFLIAALGLVGLVMPAIPILSGSELVDSQDTAVTLIERVQNMYQLNVNGLGILFIFGVVIVSILVMVLKLSVVWQTRASDR